MEKWKEGERRRREEKKGIECQNGKDGKETKETKAGKKEAREVRGEEQEKNKTRRKTKRPEHGHGQHVWGQEHVKEPGKKRRMRPVDKKKTRAGRES